MCHFGPWNLMGRIKQKHNLLHQTLNDETGFSQRVIQPRVEIMPSPVTTTLKPPGLLVRILTIYWLVFVLKHLTQSLWKQFLSSQSSGLCLTTWERNTPISYLLLRSWDISVLIYIHLPILAQLQGQNKQASAFISHAPSESAMGSSRQASHKLFWFSFRILTDFQNLWILDFPSSLREIPNRPIIVGPCDWPHISINIQVLFWSGNPKGQSPQCC